MKHVKTSPSLLKANTKKKGIQKCTLHTNNAKVKGVKHGGARPNQKARHDAVKKDADDRAKTEEPVIKAMRDSGNTCGIRLQST